jgi:hypothetical protein
MKRTASRSLLLAALAGAALLSGCALVAPMGVPPPGCSGIPSDPDLPQGGEANPSTSVPTGNVPIELVAIARPCSSQIIPLLYVFDDQAQRVMLGTPPAKVLTDSVFAQVEAEAYWAEVEGGQYYRIPWLDACSQASMLKEPLSFRAPPGGLLFIQYLASSCKECERLTSAIRGVIAANPAAPVRWVRIRVPVGVGRLKSS